MTNTTATKCITLDYSRGDASFIAKATTPTLPVKDTRGQRVQAQALPRILGFLAKRDTKGAFEYWHIPVNDPSPALELQKCDCVTVTDTAQEVIDQLTSTIVRSRDEHSTINIPQNIHGLKPYGYQAAAAKWFNHVWDGGKDNPMCCDEMGLGKTVSALAAILMRKSIKKFIIVCQPSQVYNWKKEISRWLAVNPEEDNRFSVPSIIMPEGYQFNTDCLQIIKPGKTIDPSRTITVISYPGLKSNTRRRSAPWEDPHSNLSKLRNMGADLIVFDEIQELRNNSIKSKAARMLDAGCKLALSGTLMNKIEQAFYPLTWLNPHRFISKSSFLSQYADHPRGAKRLSQALRTWCMISRTKKNVAGHMPALTRILTPISPSDEVKHLLRRQNKSLGSSLDKMRDEMDRIARAIKAGEMKSEDAEGLFERAAGSLQTNSIPFEEISRERRRIALEKLPAAKVIIRDRLDSLGDGQLVLFFHHKDVGMKISDMLDDMGIEWVKLDGSMSMSKRQEAIERFQSGAARVFLGSSAAYTGINLHASSYAMFIEISWTASDNRQAEARIHRAVQKFPCTVEYMVFNDSIEARMIEVFMEKEKVILDFNE